LTNELNLRGASEQLLEQLKGEAKSHDREVARKEGEKARLQKIVDQQEAMMSKYRNEEVGVPVQMWMEERRLLQVYLTSVFLFCFYCLIFVEFFVLFFVVLFVVFFDIFFVVFFCCICLLYLFVVFACCIC
jgi:hypothetical protein